MPKRTGSGGGCLAALGVLLCWGLGFALVPGGLTVAGIGVHDYYAHDRPIRCGDEDMPNDDRYYCLNGGGSFDNMVENRREELRRAPYLIGFGAAGAVAGAVAFAAGTRAYRRRFPDGRAFRSSDAYP
ncbi:hypothetical protein [Streptomyces marincola]|uniref:hypothetical protein n=1 Tax=Streptomyces marincola TaxID=2878388 RepID=UPI001CF5B96D|nr:hypothetical protein [Streptomyces marincola]UCM87796.1 hypothetical protein LC193_07445 [Streptomyces marincola]